MNNEFKVFVIEDDNAKFDEVKKSLERVLIDVVIEREVTFSSGMGYLYKACKNGSKKFDLIIIDNYIPNCNPNDTPEALAKLIANEIKRLKIETPICQISSALDKDAKCDFFIKYDSSVLLDSYIKEIIHSIHIDY